MAAAAPTREGTGSVPSIRLLSSAPTARLAAELATGRDADLVGELQALVAQHSLRERMHGQLVVALYPAGRQAEALELMRAAPTAALAVPVALRPCVFNDRLAVFDGDVKESGVEMQNKIALEEHWETSEFANHAARKSKAQDYLEDYFKDVVWRLGEVDRRVEDNLANGIGLSVISFTQPGVEALTDADEAVDTARRVNEQAAEFVTRHPENLRAFAAVPLQDPERAADELKRAVRDVGCVGALVNGYPNIGDANTPRYLDEPEVEPFWEMVEELDVPVYLHPRGPLPDQQRIYRGYGSLVGDPWGFNVETGLLALRLMLSGLFDRHPRVQVILGHMGELLPLMLPRVELRLRRHLPGTYGQHKRHPSEYFRENFYLNTSGWFRTQALQHAILELGADRILFSVDYPYESLQEASGWFDSCAISERDRAKIGRGNAAKLLRIGDAQADGGIDALRPAVAG